MSTRSKDFGALPDPFITELLGRWKTPHIRDAHPFPWTVREESTPSRYAPGGREREWVIVDDARRVVATCSNPDTAHALAATMNAAERPPAPAATSQGKDPAP